MNVGGSVNVRELAVMWLRQRADELRASANKVGDAFVGEQRRAICARVADAYRRAAALLDDEAASIEREASS